MSSNEELSLPFYKSGMDLWSCKLGDETYYLHVEDMSCPVCFKKGLVIVHALENYGTLKK